MHQNRTPKSDKNETTKRIRIVYDWILQDHITTDIISQSQLSWNISERQAYRYIKAAQKLFEETDITTLQQKKAYYLARKKKLLRDMNAEEKKTAAGVMAINRVLDSMAKLEGVTMDTLKLVNDPDNPFQLNAEVHTKQEIDYSKLSEEEIDFLIKLHAKAAQD